MKQAPLILIPLCILTFILHISCIQAQQFEWLSNDIAGSRFMDIYEINGKVYGAVSNGAMFEYDPNVDYQLSMYEFEFDNQGEPDFILNEIKSIPYPENYATIAIDYLHETKRWIIVQSSVVSIEKQKYRVILCDESFEILAEQSLDTLGYPVPFYIDHNNGKTIILGSLFGPPRDEIFYLVYSHSRPDSLPEIKIDQSEPNKMFFISSMNIDQRTGHMLTFYFNGIAVLDSTLYQVKRFDHTSHISTHHHGTLLDVGNNYFSHGALRQDWQTGFRWLVFQKYDTLFNILNTDTFGITGQDNYPFITKSLDYKDGNLLMGGHFDGPYSHLNFGQTIKKFYLAKYDLDMNQLWYKEYGGDRAYVMYGLKLLEDGSGLAYGNIADTITGLGYAYVLHFDANGEILSSQTLPNIQTSIKIVNPGDEFLRINNPEGQSVKIVMFDIRGCEVLNEAINTGLSEISTAGLPVGLYPYHLIVDRKVIACGKWVKGK